MNIELIKKYKTEFDHWLNGGKVIKASFDYEDNKYSAWTQLDKEHQWNDDAFYKPQFIINDEFSELRKALCDGKTIQIWEVIKQSVSDCSKDIYGWKDFKLFTPSSQFSGPSHHYRIKPEEPQFKEGDFVRYINSNNNKALKINNINCGFYYFDDTGMSLRIDEMIKWNPNHKELCWFTNDTTELKAVLGQFDCMTHDNFYKATNGSSYSNCEPFLNSKPSWFKD